MMMQMYYWNDCDFWRGHFAKRIIVLAKNVKEARIKAVAEATLWIKAEDTRQDSLVSLSETCHTLPYRISIHL